MLKVEATPGVTCSNQPLLSFTGCTCSYFCCGLGSTSPRSLVQGPASRSVPSRTGGAGGPRPQRCSSGGEKTAASRGSGSHATVEHKPCGGKGSKKTAEICKCSGKSDCVHGASAASSSCSRAVSTQAVSLFFPPTYLILSEKPFHEVSAKTAPNQPGSRWLAGWEVLSGKQSCKNQKGIYFHIYKASLQREAHGYLVSSAGAEL